MLVVLKHGLWLQALQLAREMFQMCRAVQRGAPKLCVTEGPGGRVQKIELNETPDLAGASFRDICLPVQSYSFFTMSHVKIDISRGMEVPGSHAGSASAAAPSLPFLRRRKGLVLMVILSVMLLLVVNRSHLSDASSSIRWVKDSMRTPSSPTADSHQANQPAPPAAPLPNDFGVGVAQQDATGLGNSANGATDAFRKLAEEQGYSPEEIEKLAAASGPAVPQGPPTSTERLLLFFHALSNPFYTVPSWEFSWRTQLVPLSEKAFAKSLSQVGGEAGQADVALVSAHLPL